MYACKCWRQWDPTYMRVYVMAAITIRMKCRGSISFLHLKFKKSVFWSHGYHIKMGLESVNHSFVWPLAIEIGIEITSCSSKVIVSPNEQGKCLLCRIQCAGTWDLWNIFQWDLHSTFLLACDIDFPRDRISSLKRIFNSLSFLFFCRF